MSSPVRSKPLPNFRALSLVVALVASALATAAPKQIARAADSTRARASGVVATGRRAPAFVVERPDGSELSSKHFLGHPYVINVFAAWCGSCRTEEPLLVDAFAKYRDRVAFLGIDEQEGVARAVAFARELRVPYPIAIDDGPFAASYDTSKIPETILVDRRGIVRAIYRGLISSDQLESSLALIAKKD